MSLFSFNFDSFQGGIAGGTKFIVAGILFKLATDEYGLYDGFEGAIKVAGHDLKYPFFSLPQ